MNLNGTPEIHLIDSPTAIATFAQFVVCIVGLLLYALTCWMMIKYRKSTFSNPFYTLALALAIPDCLHLIVQLISAVPSVFIGYENFSFGYMAACGYFSCAAYWCLAPLMVVIGLNRYVAVCHFQSYKILFSPMRIRVLIAGCWAMGLAVPSMMFGCTCLYLVKDQAWKFYCTGGCQDFALTTNMALASSLTICVVLIYTLTFVQYKLIQRRMVIFAFRQQTSTATSSLPQQQQQQQQHDSQTRKEAALMFQFALISSVLVIYVVSFWLVALFWQNRYGDMFLNLFVSLNSCVSPVLYCHSDRNSGGDCLG